MTDRQKFWLKVALLVTVPAWLPVMVALLLIAGFVLPLWMLVDEIVDPTPSCWLGPW